MKKRNIYTAQDIERLSNQGVTQIQIDKYDIVTSIAKERAEELGVSLSFSQVTVSQTRGEEVTLPGQKDKSRAIQQRLFEETAKRTKVTLSSSSERKPQVTGEEKPVSVNRQYWGTIEQAPVSKEVLLQSRKIPVVMEKDIVVVGGGITGLVAALAAARSGARTVIIERDPFIGGNVAHMMAVYGFLDVNGRQILKGIPQKISDRMRKTGYGTDHIPSGIVVSFTYWDFSAFPIVIMEMLKEAGVEILVHNFFTDVIMKGNRIDSVLVQNKSGLQAIRGKMFLDTSGDGDLFAKAGAPFEKEEGDMMPGMLIFTVGGVDTEKFRYAIVEHPDIYEPEFEAPEYYAQHERWIFCGMRSIVKKARMQGYKVISDRPAFGGPFTPGECHVGTTRADKIDGTNARDVERAELVTREQIFDELKFIHDFVPGFENCYLLRVAPRVAVRETRRLKGDYTITEEDVLECHRFDDVVALNGYLIDDEDTFELKYPPGYHDIPYRALLPEKVDNLLVAGRCISSTHIAMRSTRGMASCMGMGEAIGTAADLCIRKNVTPRELDVRLLQKTLLEKGGYLGEKYE